MARFSPSINLIRDADQELQYIPTANARRIYSQILADYVVGIHAFSIIGSYGTGKSAFLLAMQRTFNGDTQFFAPPNGHLGPLNGVKFLSIVGSFASILDVFSQKLGVEARTYSILEELGRVHDESLSRGYGLAIVIDEFGKFLEYAAHSNPDHDLYFIQQLAEFVNDPNRHMMFITVLHQNFSTYGVGLRREQREEWEKVKGRLKELTFNEPVEQLLELAADFTNHRQQARSEHELAQLVESIDLSASFAHRHRLSTEFAAKLLPFDILAVSVLTQALQRYGQNERSLFTFLNANDYRGINNYDADEHPYYNLVCVYEYLAHNYESLLNSVNNPHYAQWGVIRRTVERAEAELAEDIVGTATKLIQVIGLLNIFAPDGAKINSTFLSEYGQLAIGLTNVSEALVELETRKLVRYIRFKDTFVLFEGTDLNIELALMEAEGKVDPINNVAPLLQEHFDFPLLLAKGISFRTGTPRIFQFHLSEEPDTVKPDGMIDGTINLVFSGDLDLSILQTSISPENPTVLYGVYKNSNQIRHALFEIAKINYVLGINRDDRVAVRELQRLKAEQIDQLNRQMLDGLYDDSAITWVWCGDIQAVTDPRKLNIILSHICETVYSQTPVFHYEMVNRSKVSSAVATARRYFFRALVDSWQNADLGFPSERVPAEKGIYLTFLKQTGIHRQEGEEWILDEPTDPDFQILWNACMQFLEGARTTPRDLKQLVDLLSQPPFKLKEGFISFWVPTFIFAKREEFALYYEGTYVHQIVSDTLDLIEKDPSKFRLKTFAVDGVRLQFFNRCRTFLQQTPSERISNTGFIETIRPFLTFYRSLPLYTQQTQRLDPKTIRLREVIAKATDPEKTFFEDFPTALGFGTLEQESVDDRTIEAFIDQLQESIRELRSCYDGLVDRIEGFVFDLLGIVDGQFPAYREVIIERFSSLRPNELLPQQRTLLMRLTSALDDQDAWLNSVVQSFLGRDIRRMRDGDEEIVYTKLRTAFQELDSLCQLDQLNADLEKELPPVALEITTAHSGSKKLLHRLPRQKEADVVELQAKLKAQFTEDESVNVSALIRLLQEMLPNE